MQRRKLGTQGLETSIIGLGCMGLTWAYGAPDEKQAIATVHHAIDVGIDHLDTAEVYGPWTNEILVGKAVRGRRDKVTIATKFGRDISPEGKVGAADSNPARIRAVCDASLKRLGIDHIDLLYQHRVDTRVPIEDVVGTMADLVKAGKVRWLGLSEASPATLARAHAVHPISALQTEYSLWERDCEPEILPACRRLGIGFVAYSPLGRGFFTGGAKRADQLGADDFRRTDPRFQPGNFEANLAVVEAVRKIADRLGMTLPQLALAWVLAQGDDIVPIPGTTRIANLEANIAATEKTLSAATLAQLAEAMPRGAAAGPRYSDFMMAMVDRAV
ncbi:MAG: aldo/keto reductase [Alphaproteobacteria bacterium]